MNFISFNLILLLFECGLPAKPNVLFIIADDLRPALKCFGDKSAYTPNIDALSKRSFLFKNTYAQQALCAPSRNSLLTSRRPDSLHLYDFYSYWRTSVGNFTTLPQYFKENGYYTYSIGKVFHPGVSSNFTDDFPYSWSSQTFRPKTERYMNAKVCLDKDGYLEQNLICPVLVESQPEGILPDLESANEAIRFLSNEDNIINKPYFLAVGFHKPHVPFKFPLKYLDFHPLENITLPRNRWRPSTLPLVAWNPWTDIRLRHDINALNVSFPFGPMPDAMTKKIIQAYNAATTYIDDLIGQVLKHVDNNTIIVLTGDHGWSRSEHGEFSKFSNFEVATRVPLLIYVPGLSKKKVEVDSFVELVDLFPTLVDLTQVGQPLDVCSTEYADKVCTEGRSVMGDMVDSLKGKSPPGKSAIFTQYPRPGPYPTSQPNSDKPHLKNIKIMGYSIKIKQFRYTEWVQFNRKTFSPNWKKVYARELYDHFIDPEENLNIVNRPQMDDIIKDLRTKLILGWRYA